MSYARRTLLWLAAVMFLSVLTSTVSADAFEAHNYTGLSFGSFAELEGITVDQANGNIYAVEPNHEHGERKEASGEVKIFGAEGGAPAGGEPSSFTGIDSPDHALSGVGFAASGVAVDPTSGDVYVSSFVGNSLEQYDPNGGNGYEYVCEITVFALKGGDGCLPDGGGEGTAPEGSRIEGLGTAIDAAGDVYTSARIGYSYESEGVWEFNAAREALQVFALPALTEGEAEVVAIAVAPGGTVYALTKFRGTGDEGRVFEFKRSSLSGPPEGAPVPVPGIEKATGIAFDRATDELFVDFGSYAEAFNAAHEVVSRFGAGILTKGASIAVNETTGEVYVADITVRKIFRFGPGVTAELPSVDAPPPAVAATRTSALLSATVDTGDATTTWQVQYVAAGEYAPGVPDPYAAGGVTAPLQLPAVAEATAVKPVPITGLLAGTTYDYRLIATSEVGTRYGENHQFTTAAAMPPIVETGAAEGVTQRGAMLTGTVNTRELQTSYEFEVGTNTAYEGAKLFGNAGTAGTVSVSTGLQFLIPGTTYHYRLVASNEDGTTYGPDVTFTTPNVVQPIVQPPAESFVPTLTQAFPSVAGAITKPQTSAKGRKKKKKAQKRRKKAKHRAKRRSRK